MLVFTSFQTRNNEHGTALTMYGRVFRLYGRYFRENSLAKKRETTHYNTAKLDQPWPNVAAPVHRDTAREKVVLLAHW